MPDKAISSRSSDGLGSLIRGHVSPQEMSGMLVVEDQAEKHISAGLGHLQNFAVATNGYRQAFPILMTYTVGKHPHQELLQHVYRDLSV